MAAINAALPLRPGVNASSGRPRLFASKCIVQNPAFSTSFIGHIDGGTLRYDGGSLGMHQALLKADGRMEFRKTWPQGWRSVVILDPFWLLPPRDRSIATAQ